MIDTAEAARTDGLQVELGGQAIQSTEQTPPATSELVGVLAAAVVLFLAFGSLFAMLLLILTAVAGVGTAILATGLLSHATTIGEIAPTLSALIGLGVGIDYALFIVTRHRKGLQSGLDVQESLVRAVNTSGRAVLFAGGTVCIALLGMFVLQTKFLNGVAVASALTVALTVLASVTLLPALLGLLGARVLGRRARRRLAEGEPLPENATSGPWARWAALVQRRPRVLSLVALVVMVVLLPVFSLRLGSSDAGNNPASTTTRKAYDLLADGFGPGFNGPLQLVAQAPSAADKAALTKLSARLEKVEGVASVAAPPIRQGSTVGIVQVVPTTSPQDKQTSDLIDHLRDEVIPAAEKGTTLRVYVGGTTAIFNDFATVLTGKLPLFIAVIVILGGLLLLLAFRSLLIPAVAAVMNLLAAGASFGVLIAVFQWGWGSDAMGLGQAGPVEAFLPVMMISILFGLSMDYQVFLVSRMHEEWVHTKDNARAVRVGQVETARVITAAAAIMVCVFIAFVFGGERTIAEFGIGLAAAVALDAFILRTILVPASMHLFGKANWWLPAWLDRRMPHLSVDPPDEPLPAPSPDSPAPEPEPSTRPEDRPAQSGGEGALVHRPPPPAPLRRPPEPRTSPVLPDQVTSMTNLLVLGGSGRTGIHVLIQAVGRGHRVRALVRDPDAVQAPVGVELIQGTPSNVDDIRKAAQDSEAVISALNNSRASDNPWAKSVSPPMFMTDDIRNTLTVMSEQNIRRIVLTSTQNSGDGRDQFNPAFRALVKLSNLKATFDDHDGVDEVVRASGTYWTLVRAVLLADKPLVTPVRAAEAGTEKPGPRINRGDLAGFLLDTVEQGTWIRKAPVVWNAGS